MNQDLDFENSLDNLSESMGNDDSFHHNHSINSQPGLAAQINHNQQAIDGNSSLLQANQNMDVDQAKAIKLNGTSIHVNLQSIEDNEASISSLIDGLSGNAQADASFRESLAYLPARFDQLQKSDVAINAALLANATKDMKQSEKIAFLESQLSKNQEYIGKMFSILVNHQRMLKKIYS